MAYEGGKRAWWLGSCESRNKEIRHCKRSKWNFNSKMKFAQEDVKPHGVCITVRPIGLGDNIFTDDRYVCRTALFHLYVRVMKKHGAMRK